MSRSTTKPKTFTIQNTALSVNNKPSKSNTSTPNIALHNNISKPSVSPFTLSNSLNQQIPIQSTIYIDSIKQINQQYAQLFYKLFQNNKYIKNNVNAEVINSQLGEGQIKFGREQRYQLECMKMLSKCKENIDKLDDIKQTVQNWNKIVQFIKTVKKQPQIQLTKPKQKIHRICQVYQQLNYKLQQTQKLYSSLLQKQSSDYNHILQKQDKSLTQTQRQFKRNQRKLNKLLQQQQYYKQKCETKQKILQQIQIKIKKYEQNKSGLQMKYINDKYKYQRTIKKMKDRQKSKDKQIKILNDNQRQNKVVRSKSSIRMNRNKQYPNVQFYQQI